MAGIRDMTTEDDGDQHAIDQRDELESMAAIFADDFTLHSDNAGAGADGPISYSIALRPDFGAADKTIDDVSIRPPGDLALTVTYPHNYPDTTPIFGLDYDKRNMSLHDVQERALLKVVITAAEEELGMPSVYSCIQAAKEFLEHGGLDQAGIALLSDDCLAHILSYLAASKDDIENIRSTLPICEAASKSNVVWKQLCQRRWIEKWGFEKRWERALENSKIESDQHCWMQAYHVEEEAAKRNFLTRDELPTMTFDYRQWFSFTLFRNQPDNMRDILPTGLRESLARDVVFLATGTIFSEEREWLRRLIWESSSCVGLLGSQITQVKLKLASSGSSVEQFTVYRMKNWGWELRGSDYILRAVDTEGDKETLWNDFISNIFVQDKPDWIEPHRAPYPYNFREIPDDEDCKIMLDW